MNKNKLKSIGAVAAGFLVVVILSTLTDTVLEKAGIFPPIEAKFYVPWMLFLALFYRSVYTIFAGYLTARLAPQNKKKHVKILGIIGTVAGILGVIAGWNLSAHWYPIALAAAAYPSVWLGGKLYLKSAHANK